MGDYDYLGRLPLPRNSSGHAVQDDSTIGNSDQVVPANARSPASNSIAPSGGNPPPINDLATPHPSYGSLGFDPNGAGQWAAAMRHPVDAIIANNLANEALQITKQVYKDDPNLLHNDEADGFRHAYWNLRMAQTFGPEVAKQFGDGHEITDPNPNNERLMDLYNNQIGRKLAATAGGGTPTDIVKAAINRGMVRNKPF